MFGAPWCPDCRRSKQFLNEQRIPYEWNDIDQDEEARRYVQRVNDGFCGTLDCSLREAIASGDSGYTIVVPMGTYTLTLGTELAIGTSLTLNGAGSGDTIIQAAASSAAATSRVFSIDSGNNVAISEVTIRHGKASGSFGDNRGGGIFNRGTLSLTPNPPMRCGYGVGTRGEGHGNATVRA